MVHPQLQGRAGARMQRSRKGGCAGLADASEALKFLRRLREASDETLFRLPSGRAVRGPVDVAGPGRRRADAAHRAAQVHPGMRFLPHGFPARDVARGLMAAHHDRAGPALRHRCVHGCGQRAADQRLAAGQRRHLQAGCARRRRRIASPWPSGSSASTTRWRPRCSGAPASRPPPTARPVMAVPSEVISANTPFAFRSEANITMINTTFSAPASKPATRRTVDAPTRVMHWLMALSFLGAYVTADGERWRLLHVTLGYTLAGLLAFRVVWGLIGPRHARLSGPVAQTAGAATVAQGPEGGRAERAPGAEPVADPECGGAAGADRAADPQRLRHLPRVGRRVAGRGPRIFWQCTAGRGAGAHRPDRGVEPVAPQEPGHPHADRAGGRGRA
jgi:hypothetical protein